jgi:hypothetical protein
MKEKCIKEIIKGVHMGILGIEHVVEKIDNPKLKDVVIKQKKEYQSLLKRIHKEYPDVEDKKPGAMVESMVEMRTMFSNDSDIVKMLMKGCNSAVIAMTECINDLEEVDQSLQGLADDVEDISKNYEERLKKFL